MRVLLTYVNPSRELLPAPPIGLAYVASATRRAGHDVRVLDLFGHRRPLDAVGDAVRAWAPAVVGISVRNIDNVVLQRAEWHLGALAPVVAVIRRESVAPVVLGGPAVSILGATALRRIDADFAVAGEGESAFPRLLSAIAAGGGYEDIPGLCYRTGPGIVANAAVPIARFGASGMEDWIDWSTYERQGGTWAIQTKRGCAFHCSYCVYPAIEGHLSRRRPAEDVVDEIERVAARARPRTFDFVDSTFNVPPDHAEAICREIIRRRLAVNLTAMGVNPLGVSRRLLVLMREAGFNSMMITAESASDRMLRSLRKGFTADQVHATAHLARESGIASTWFFMLGGPGETRDTVEETVSFVERQLGWPGCLTVFMTGIRVLPGTELARQVAHEPALAVDGDLVAPVFHVAPGLDEGWILDRINRAIARVPGIVHAAEEGVSRYERAANRVLNALGVAPPYWRFLPLLLRLPPLPALRRHHPFVARRPPAGGPNAEPVRVGGASVPPVGALPSGRQAGASAEAT